MAIQFQQPGEIRVPSNFIGDPQYFGSPEYFEFINANAGVPRTADLAYTSPYFRGGLSSSFGASQDAAIKRYLDRVQAQSTAGGVITNTPTSNTVTTNTMTPNYFYSNPINFLTSPPITPGEPAANASQIDASIRPFLTEGLRQAQEIFLRQQPQFFPGQTYVSPSEQTLQALQQQENIARAGSPILGEAQGAFLRGLTAPSAATPLYQSIFGAAGMQPGADVYGQAAGGQFQNIATGQLANIAGGGFLQGSPYQQAMMEAATRPLIQQYGETVLPGISSLYSRSGRLGSGAMERALERSTEAFGRSIGDVTANLAGTQFQQERALQQQALGQLAGVSAQDIQTRLAGAQGLQQAQQAALGTQLQAAGGVGTGQYQELTRQLGAAQAAPQIYGQQFLPSQTLAQVGAQREAIAAQPLQEQMARFGFQQRLPYEQLSGYLSSVYGSPLGSYGTPAPQPQFAGNRTVGALGGALAGGLGGYALGQAFPSLGFGGGFGLPAIGAIGGGLLGGGFF
jgi:hypothetical protein